MSLQDELAGLEFDRESLSSARSEKLDEQLEEGSTPVRSKPHSETKERSEIELDVSKEDKKPSLLEERKEENAAADKTDQQAEDYAEEVDDVRHRLLHKFHAYYNSSRTFSL